MCLWAKMLLKKLRHIRVMPHLVVLPLSLRVHVYNKTRWRQPATSVYKNTHALRSQQARNVKKISKKFRLAEAGSILLLLTAVGSTHLFTILLCVGKKSQHLDWPSMNWLHGLTNSKTTPGGNKTVNNISLPLEEQKNFSGKPVSRGGGIARQKLQTKSESSRSFVTINKCRFAYLNRFHK